MQIECNFYNYVMIIIDIKMIRKILRFKRTNDRRIRHNNAFLYGGEIIKDSNKFLEFPPETSLKTKINLILNQLTLEEKISMLGGTDSFAIKGIPRLNLPKIWMSDATSAVRCFGKATGFPAPIAMTATWNRKLLNQVAIAIGEEARAKGVSVLLGPGLNIYRVPTCGRNFEYMGEDPFLASELVISYIQGVQSKGVIATIKHFICNNSEYNRHRMNSIVDQRTLHEIYFPAFKAAIQKGHAKAVMNAYNPVNGKFSSENKYLLTNILRNKWNFKGFVMSDWVSVYDTKAPLLAGLDLEMPSGLYLNYKKIKPLLDSGAISQENINTHVKNIIRSLFEMGIYERPMKDHNYQEFSPEHTEIALKAAREGIVLLKNDKKLLPIDVNSIKNVIVMGKTAIITPVSGGGACHYRSDETINIFEGFKNAIKSPIKLKYIPQKSRYSKTEQLEIKNADYIFICVGFSEIEEAECWDRSWKMENNQNQFIRKINSYNSNSIVILTAGAGLETESWIQEISTIIHSFYLGQTVGKAITDIIFGKKNPSGKLPFTMAKKWTDFEAVQNYVKKPEKYSFIRAKLAKGKPIFRRIQNIEYKEQLNVGYRHFDSNKIEPQFPFGFGLSYTQFELKNLKLSSKEITKNEEIRISLTLSNIGEKSGAEVVQLYIHDVHSSLYRPYKELKGFEKIYLNPTESKEIHFKILPEHLKYYDDKLNDWILESGKFKIMIGNSSRNILLEDTFNVIDN